MTGIIPKVGENPIPDADRDHTVESDWFPIFRSGKYPQADFTTADVQEVADEFNLTGRRSPVVFDHLTKADLAPDSKPVAAAGNIIALRAVDSIDPRYPGTKVLEARAKMSWWARHRTRDGEYRNLSASFSKSKHPTDQKVRRSLHHVALLGAAPPALQGLPEVIFSEQTPNETDSEILSFVQEGGIPLPHPSKSHANNQEHRVETINFTEHTARLEAKEAQLNLAHSQELIKFREELATATEQVTSFKEQLEAAVSAHEATKAGIPAAIETARQEGIVEGERIATEKATASFKEQTERAEVTLFTEGLLKSGKINQKEFALEGKLSLVDTILSIPAGPARESFRELLSKRPALVPEVGAQPVGFRGVALDSGELSPEKKEEAQVSMAKELVKKGEYSNFRAAYEHVVNLKEA